MTYFLTFTCRDAARRVIGEEKLIPVTRHAASLHVKWEIFRKK